MFGNSFCKRGFSNAQALGGHLNIHRKEKAKLKKSANQDRRPWIADIRQVALFAETPHSQEPPACQPIHWESTQKDLDLDLELRLGPHPQDSSPPTNSVVPPENSFESNKHTTHM
ncbi:hypothetical protein L6164_019239 [Bauhinia variegata]|uniref:Uncharacterized protein n=1 Tax=Bauhinia variegata TaxID=167791 RepID=A0ACB9NF51_BAUVA|nr:hypothetical protein L6164_019239 [Bauhinia variegata]